MTSSPEVAQVGAPGRAPLQLEPPGPGVWQRDEDHWPRPVPRSYAELYTEATIPYVKEWTRRYGLLLDYFETRFPHGFGYGRVHAVGEPKKGGSGPPPKPVLKLLLKVHPELRARRRAAEKALSERLWLADAERWEHDAKPAVVAENRANAAVNRAGLSDDQLLAHVERCRGTLQRFIGLHHRFNGAMVPVGLLVEAVREWTGDDRAVLDLLRGASPVSSGRSEELDRLIGAIRADPQARTALSDDDAEAALSRLATTEGPVGQAFREYVETVGYRLVGDSIDHGNPTLVEVPELMVRTIVGGVDGDPDEPVPSLLGGRRNELRSRVPAAHQPEFDRLLDDTLRTYAMRDERSVYADVWAAGIFRQALLELGRRLTLRDALAEPVHLVEATADEVRALHAGGGPSPDALAARARFRVEHAGHAAPATIGGEPTPPPPLDALPGALRQVNAAIFAQFAGMFERGPAQTGSEILRGTVASPGRYEGTARVVVRPEQLHRIERGDVLVARTTSEAFNTALPLLGAIVTDRGGVLSHAAIISREAGIPCVVATGEATQRIPDGTRIVVDGSAGEVQLEPRR